MTHHDDFHQLVLEGMARGRRMRGAAAAKGIHGISRLVRSIFARGEPAEFRTK